MDFEIIDEIYSNVIDMDDDYEIVKQEVSTISSSSSSSSSSLSSLSSLSYQWIILLIVLLLVVLSINIIRYIKYNNDYKKLKETLSSSLSSSLDDELMKLEKELDNASLSETFILRLQMITDHIIHDTTTSSSNDSSSNNNIMKYGNNLSRIDKILQTLVSPKKRLSIPSFLSYMKVIITTNTLIELDQYIIRFNIIPLLENRSFKADLDNARNIYEQKKYTNSSENLKLSSIHALKSACCSDNADVIREALAFAKSFNLDIEYSDEYNNADITLQNLEKVEKKVMIKEKQRRLNEHISIVSYGAQKIKSELIESGNTLINGIVNNNDIMLVEMETSSATLMNTIKDDDDNNTNDSLLCNDDPSDIIQLNNTSITTTTSNNDQLILFNNDNSNAILPLSNRTSKVVLMNQNGNIVSNPDIKQQFALTVHKTETDIINLNKDTGLEIAKAVKEYNQTIDDNDRHMEEEWKKSREAARIRVEKKISDAKIDDNKFTLALQQNKRLSDKLDMYTNNSDENTYICHQKWKSIQQKWDATFYIITITISFYIFIKTSSSHSIMMWLDSLLESLCYELSIHDQTARSSINTTSSYCESNNTCNDRSNTDGLVWWNYDPFRPLSYVFGIAIYNTITFLAYFKLSISSMGTLKCCLNILTRIMTPLMLSFLTYKYANMIQLSKYILVIGSCLCLFAPITRFFSPFRNYSYLLLGHSIFHFLILGLDWHLTWTVSFFSKWFDLRWFLVYVIYPIFITVLSGYLGCMQYSDNMKNQELQSGFALKHSYDNDFFSLTECLITKLGI